MESSVHFVAFKPVRKHSTERRAARYLLLWLEKWARGRRQRSNEAKHSHGLAFLDGRGS